MQNNADTCIHCGAIIPEGGWFCKNCDGKGRGKEVGKIHMQTVRERVYRAASKGPKAKTLCGLFRIRG